MILCVHKYKRVMNLVLGVASVLALITGAVDETSFAGGKGGATGMVALK